VAGRHEDDDLRPFDYGVVTTRFSAPFVPQSDCRCPGPLSVSRWIAIGRSSPEHSMKRTEVRDCFNSQRNTANGGRWAASRVRRFSRWKRRPVPSSAYTVRLPSTYKIDPAIIDRIATRPPSTTSIAANGRLNARDL